MTKEELFACMKGTIIVSCQATPGEPLYDPERSVMPLMARAAKQAGAKMIRTSSVRDIVGIKEETGLPVIGLIKREYPGYSGRITMTMREVDECMDALADIVSIDCTDTPRGDGRTAPEFLLRRWFVITFVCIQLRIRLNRKNCIMPENRFIATQSK